MFKKLYQKLIVMGILVCAFILFYQVSKVYAEEITDDTAIAKLKGDFNGDGKKDVTDLLIMLRHIASSKNITIRQKYPEWYQEEKIDEMDMNRDGKVDVTDCLALQRHIAAYKNEKIAFRHPEWLIKDVIPEELKLNVEKVTISLAENKEVQLIPYIASTNEEIFTDLTWESSNPEVATVNRTGKVVGVSEGNCIIKVMAPNAIEATCEVTVEQGIIEIRPESICLDQSNLELQLNQTKNVKLEYRISPSNANTDIEVTWESSNPEVAQVDEQGKVTPKSEGNAVIIAKTTNEKIASCNILVKNTNEVIDIYPESLENETPEITIQLNENAYSEMKTKIIPENANIGTTITYSSSDTSIVQVDNAGILRGVKEGTCTITATTENGKTTQSTVTVENGSIEPESIQINEEGPIVLSINHTAKLTATIMPDNVNTAAGLTWGSSNEAIASVDSNGLVKANQEGTCTISVATENGKTANVEVNVTSEKILPEKIDIAAIGGPGLPDVGINETVEMRATITPSNASDKSVTWSSSNENVAVVSAQGIVTTKSAGDCTITVTTVNQKTASYRIRVIGSSQPIEILPERVYVGAIGDSDLPNVKINNTVEMRATITPSNATNKKVTWSSSNENVAVVDEQGMVTAKSAGDCTITATTVNGKSDHYRLRVVGSSQPIEILPEKVDIAAIGGPDLPDVKVNDTIEMRATITPSNATNKKVIWTSSNENIAVVNEQGVVRARAAGNCTITATTVNQKTSSYRIRVIGSSQPVEILPTGISVVGIGEPGLPDVKVNGTVEMRAEITPYNATNKNVTWTSSNDNVAVVNAQGIVRARAVGNCRIIGTTVNGKSAFFEIRVIADPTPTIIVPTSVSIQTGGQTILEENQTKQLSAVILPTNANTSTGIEWRSSDPRIATVNSNGLVTAIKEGTCTITVTTENLKSNTCTITVRKQKIYPTSIVIEPAGSTNLSVNGLVKLNAKISPTNATDGTAITWSTSNANVAVVNNQGLVQAKGAGTCNITATTANGVTTTCSITVQATPQDTTAPVLEVASSYTGDIITGGSTVTYQINIVEDDLRSFDPTKVKLTGNLASKSTLRVTGSGKSYVASVTVPDELGRIRLEIEAGAAVDQNNNRSLGLRFRDTEAYVCKLNTAPVSGTKASEGFISTVVDAGNSFYTKSFQFALNNSVGGRTVRDTNEWVYTQLNNGGTYMVGCHVTLYTGNNDDTITGYVQKEVTIPTDAAKNVRIHFMNLARNIEYPNLQDEHAKTETNDGDCMLIITPNEKTILIDCGSYEHGAQKVDAYLNHLVEKENSVNVLKPDANGVVTIDYYLNTHSHNDHIGGFRGITGWWSNQYNANNLKTGKTNNKQRRYEFRNIIVGCNYDQLAVDKDGNPTGDDFVNNLKAYASKQNVPITTVMAGNCLNIDGVLLNIFNPYPLEQVPLKWLDTKNKKGIRTDAAPVTVKKANGKSHSNYEMASKNSQSIVAKIIYGNNKYLSTGDKEIFIDELLLGKAKDTTWWTASTATNNNNQKQTFKVSLAQDIAASEGITASQAVTKYKLNRFTPKDVRAQVFKWGHHSRPSGGTLALVEAANPETIVFSAHSYSGKYIESNVLTRMKKYYDGKTNIALNSSNWDTNWSKWIFSTNKTGNNTKTLTQADSYTGGFLLKTNGTSWDYSNPRGK